MKKTLALLCLLLALPCAARASYISLNTTLSSRFGHGKLTVMVSVVNKGDESAFNVQAELRAGGKDVLAEKKTELAVGGAYQVKEEIPLALDKPGTYPLTLIMHYTDANQYPFSALTCQLFVSEHEAVSPLFGQMKPAVFTKEGSLDFTLKNLGDHAITARTVLFAPRELTAAEDARELTVGPKGEQSSTFALKNFSALAGSTYQVFAVSEFDDNGLHYTSIFPSTVKIVAEQAVFGLGYPLLIALLAALVVLFIGAQFFLKKK